MKFNHPRPTASVTIIRPRNAVYRHGRPGGRDFLQYVEYNRIVESSKAPSPEKLTISSSLNAIVTSDTSFYIIIIIIIVIIISISYTLMICLHMQ